MRSLVSLSAKIYYPSLLSLLATLLASDSILVWWEEFRADSVNSRMFSLVVLQNWALINGTLIAQYIEDLRVFLRRL